MMVFADQIHMCNTAISPWNDAPSLDINIGLRKTYGWVKTYELTKVLGDKHPLANYLKVPKVQGFWPINILYKSSQSLPLEMLKAPRTNALGKVSAVLG